MDFSREQVDGLQVSCLIAVLFEKGIITYDELIEIFDTPGNMVKYHEKMLEKIIAIHRDRKE